jgi:outer membrane immunogenic protein
MKKLLLSAAALALVGGSALAADLPTYEAAPAVAPMVSAFNWTGFYAGVQTGYAWGDADVAGVDVGDDYDVDGWLLGGFAGFNFEISSFVAGIEADLEWVNADGDNAVGSATELNWQGSLRGRLGVALDRVLLYGTGGLAIADIDADFVGAVAGDPPAPTVVSTSGTELGWTVGAGVDFAVTDQIFVRGEYRYTDFGEIETPADVDQELDFHTVRVGAGFMF